MTAHEGDGNLAPLLVPTSPGQVLDRITILQIKAGKTLGLSGHSTVLVELTELLKRSNAAIPASAALTGLEAELRRVNAELWDVEDRLRLYESHSNFGDGLNDERFGLKRRVDILLRSALSETKVYVLSNN